MNTFAVGSSDPLFLMEESVRVLKAEKNREADPEMALSYNVVINGIEMAAAYYRVCLLPLVTESMLPSPLDLPYRID